jgi:1-acyl-sn-glycerol-3-phosphate acyltransferase
MSLKIPLHSFGRPLAWYHRWFWHVGRIVVRLLGGRRDPSMDTIPLQGPAVVVAPHLSFLDPLFLAAALPRPSRFIAASFFVTKNALLSWLFFLGGVIPVHHHRKDPTALRRALRLLAQGELVAFFPEGARTWTGVPGSPMTPAVKFLMGLKVPVYLAAFDGAYDSWPRFDSVPRPRKVTVRIAGPLALPHTIHAPARVTNGIPRPWWSRLYAPGKKAVNRGAEELRSQLTAAAAGEAALLRLEIPGRVKGLTQVLCFCPECASAALVWNGGGLACPACGVGFRPAANGRLHRIPTNGGAQTDFSLHEAFARMASAVKARAREGFTLEETVETAGIPQDLATARPTPFVSASARLDRSGLRIQTNGRGACIPLAAVATSGFMGSETLEITNPSDGTIVYVRKPGGAMRILLTARAHLGLPLESMTV